MTEQSLYHRLGGYDAIAAVTDDLMKRVKSDAQLGRFYAHRGDDGMAREQQLLVEFICAAAGGPIHYPGRAMKPVHIGMRISLSDWDVLIRHLNTTLDRFEVAKTEKDGVLAFIESTRADIVEIKE